MSAKTRTYNPVDASPVKSFFVTMLTRDIELSDAILDLLDNCVDGIHRSKKKGQDHKPFGGFKASINFDATYFKIEDNCGGIPWGLHDYAFRMGKASGKEEKLGTVGVYGIGMKRAIFKIGNDCKITSQNASDSYEVEISSRWIADEKEWNLPVKAAQKLGHDGTAVYIKKLNSGIADQFSDSAFEADLIKKIQTHYSIIILKGFEVKVNGKKMSPAPLRLNWDDSHDRNSIRPFVYKTKVDGVDVFLTVGFTRSIPSQEEAFNNQDKIEYSSDYAGWTLVCNDRVVAYCDKSELTGWGEAGIPQYHTQFIAISGIVEFSSNDASKLPMTTTKRGIDTSSTLYLQVKNKMREGLRYFITYTNKWKKDIKTSKEHIRAATPLSLEEIKQKVSSTKMTVVKLKPGGHQYVPSLPSPPTREDNKARISFTKRKEDIKIVGEYLLKEPDAKPDLVGEACFNTILKEAKK